MRVGVGVYDIDLELMVEKFLDGCRNLKFRVTPRKFPAQ